LSSRAQRRNAQRKRPGKGKCCDLKLEQAKCETGPPIRLQREPKLYTYQKWVLEVRLAPSWLCAAKTSRLAPEEVLSARHSCSLCAMSHMSLDSGHSPASWKVYSTTAFQRTSDKFSEKKFGKYTQRGHPVRNFRRDLEDLRTVSKDFVPDLGHPVLAGADQYCD